MEIIHCINSLSYGGASLHVRNLTSAFNDKQKIFVTNIAQNIDDLSVLSLWSMVRIAMFRKKVIFHVHGRGAMAKLILLFIVLRVNFIYSPHGIHSASGAMRVLNDILHFLIAGFARHVIYVSESEKQNYFKKFRKPKKCSVILNGIEGPRNWSMKSKNGRKVVYVARFHYQKNINLFVEIAENNINYMFYIIGDGETKSEVENLIAKKNINNIELLGYKQNVLQELHKYDIYLSTSRWEGMPYSVIEALASGLPCILSNVPGHDDIAKFGGNCISLFDCKSEIPLILDHLTKSYQERQAASREVFEKKFTLSAMIEQYNTFYNSDD